MEPKAEHDKLNKDEAQKRSYKSPQLFSYGNIREITRNMGPKGALDNGGGSAAGPKTGT
jgi:hypothetical protein